MKPGDYDLVIVGSGAGGSAMAYACALKKVRVLLLEAGPRFDPFKDYKLDQEDWERHHFPHKPGSEGRHSYGEMQELDASLDDLRSWNHAMGRTNRTNKRKVFKYHHVRGVGGSTLAYTGEAHRMHPESMQMRSRFKVAADWPLTYSDLEPFYCEAERVVGVAGPKDAGVRWRSQAYPLPAHPLNYASQHLQKAAQRIGLNWVANPRAALSEPYDDRPNCNYCAGCSSGCPRTDKGSVDVTFLRKAEASGFCRIESGVTVTRIEPGKTTA
jgi:choline dehydrogenase-like flavoprotein